MTKNIHDVSRVGDSNGIFGGKEGLRIRKIARNMEKRGTKQKGG
jgi:hypothetical protein